jgi:hypothetical protein
MAAQTTRGSTLSCMFDTAWATVSSCMRQLIMAVAGVKVVLEGKLYLLT